MNENDNSSTIHSLLPIVERYGISNDYKKKKLIKDDLTNNLVLRIESLKKLKQLFPIGLSEKK